MAEITRLDIALVQGLLLGCVGTLFYYLLQGLGNKSMAGLMRMATIMAVIGVVIPAVWAMISDLKLWIESIVTRIEALPSRIFFWR